MPSALTAALLGAFQASVSVLLTLGYGFIAARLGMISDASGRDISVLCSNIFLPALLITEVGGGLNVHRVLDYVPIVAWAIIYPIVSIIMGKIAVKSFGLPTWTIAAITFNNTTSLPLLLTKSLFEAGIFGKIVGGDVQKAVTRANSYFLVSSLVSKVLTFSIGPRLLGEDTASARERPREVGHEEEQSAEPHERTSLFPRPNSKKDVTTSFGSIREGIKAFSNPATWAGIIAVTIGLVPALHRAAFAPNNEGGFLNAWVMPSIRHVGGLFSAMQIFVVGSRISNSFSSPRNGASSQPPIAAVITIVVVRFAVWGAISIPLIYLLAVNTNLLGGDPILWWCLMLMPVGPPAIIWSALLELVGAEPRTKMMVARMLAYCYLVTPIIAFAVMGALRATEAAQSRRHF